jgi:glycosyltransferase involved in cell wall biosynthesis
MTSPAVTVVVAVYNRTEELRRALLSVQGQTYQDFECLVVDDGSTIPIEPIVASLDDPRFIYMRQENSGPTKARSAAGRIMRGDIGVGLDSDHEAYPWMLSRVVAYLDEMPEIDAVAGMFVRMSDGCLLVNVEGGSKLMTPADYVREPLIPDCVSAVRRRVVQEWLQERDDYFAFEARQWFTFHMNHTQLFVGEPWARMYVDSAERVSQRVDDRVLDDYCKFLEEHRRDLETTRAVVLDQLVANGWFQLTRAGRKEDAARFAELMRMRGLSRCRTLVEKGARKASRLLRRTDPPAYRLR